MTIVGTIQRRFQMISDSLIQKFVSDLRVIEDSSLYLEAGTDADLSKQFSDGETPVEHQLTDESWIFLFNTILRLMPKKTKRLSLLMEQSIDSNNQCGKVHGILSNVLSYNIEPSVPTKDCDFEFTECDFSEACVAPDGWQ